MNNLDKIAHLFKRVTETNSSLSKVFTECGRKWKMSKDSVRNLYYNNYEFVKNNENFCLKNNIDREKLIKAKVQEFTKEQEKELITKVNEKIKAGKSVRKACLELAGGDADLMVRYLNKYRAVCEKYKGNLDAKKEDGGKIIKMPNRADVLTDADIQSLFMGLVRLVKNNTIKEMDFAINQKYKEKVLEISTLKQSFNLIKNELEEEKRQNEKLKSEIAILKRDRLDKYKSLMKSLKGKEARQLID